MNKFRKYVLCFFVLIPDIPILNAQIIVWPVVDPNITFKYNLYWESASGYGKKVPSAMIARNNEYYRNVDENFKLSLKEKSFQVCSGKKMELTKDPLNSAGNSESVFVDLSCGLVRVSDNYPFYRKTAINFDPQVYYHAKVYNGSGDIIKEISRTDLIDYTSEIRGRLRGLMDYEYDLEIVKVAMNCSFQGKILEEIIQELCDYFSEPDPSMKGSDRNGFNTRIGLLINQRKNMYPGYFDDIGSKTAQTQSQNPKPAYPPVAEQKPVTSVNPQMTAAFNAVRQQSKNWALVVGINDYQSPDINDLSNPLSDANSLASVLLEKYNFTREEMIFLENPTREGIIRAFDYLATVIRPVDNLIIFYAGHGLWDEKLGKGYWIPSDATLENRANWFSNSDLRDYISGIKSHHTLLITDACFSGGIFKTREAFNQVSPATYEMYKLPSRKAMTSGAMTTVPDKSVFIEYLLKRLTDNTEPFLSSEQLFSSFKIAVINNSPTKQVPQYGEIREAGDEGGDFIFTLR